jgi:hypothetical protein
MGVKDFKQVDGDIYIDPISGDFVMVDSDNQHILDILESFPGWWKNSLPTGAGIPVLLKAKVTTALTESVIKQQLEADGYQVTRPYINIDSAGKFTIQPNAIRP